MNSVNYREMILQASELINGLDKLGKEYVVRNLHDGIQIMCEDWDVVCHGFSYGSEGGLFEAMGSIVNLDDESVEGYLSAKEILSRL